MTGFKGHKRRWILALAVIAALAAAAVWHFRHPAPTDFKTVKATQRDLQQNVLATGQLDAVRKVDVGAQVSGQLKSCMSRSATR